MMDLMKLSDKFKLQTSQTAPWMNEEKRLCVEKTNPGVNWSSLADKSAPWSISCEDLAWQDAHPARVLWKERSWKAGGRERRRLPPSLFFINDGRPTSPRVEASRLA